MDSNAKMGIASFGDALLRGYELGNRIRREKTQDARDASLDDLRRTNAELETQRLQQGVSMYPIQKQIAEGNLAQQNQAIKATENILSQTPVANEMNQVNLDKMKADLAEKNRVAEKNKTDLALKASSSAISVFKKLSPGQSFNITPGGVPVVEQLVSSLFKNTSGVASIAMGENGGMVATTTDGSSYTIPAQQVESMSAHIDYEKITQGMIPVSGQVTLQDGRVVNWITENGNMRIIEESTPKTKPKDVVGINEEEVGNGVYYDPETQTYRNTEIVQGKQVPSGRVAMTNKHGITVLGADSGRGNMFKSSTVEAVNIKTGARNVINIDDITEDGDWVSLYDTAALKKAGFDPVALASDMVVRRGGGVPASLPGDEAAGASSGMMAPSGQPAVVKYVGTKAYYYDPATKQNLGAVK